MATTLQDILLQRMMQTQAPTEPKPASVQLPMGPWRPFGKRSFVTPAQYDALSNTPVKGDPFGSGVVAETPEDAEKSQRKREAAEAAAEYQSDMDVDKIAADLASRDSTYGPLSETVGPLPWAKATLSSVPILQDVVGDEIPSFGLGGPEERARINGYRTSLGTLRNDVKQALATKGNPSKWEQQQILPLLPSMTWFETPDAARSNLESLRQNMSETVIDIDNVMRTTKMPPGKGTDLRLKRDAAMRAIKRIDSMLSADSASQKIAEPKSRAERDALPSGSLYKAPDGSVMRKK